MALVFDGVGIVALVVAAILIAVVAFFYSNLGLGGGQLYVPIMVIVFPAAVFAMKDIVPLSLCFAFATMAMSVYSHNRKKLVHFKVGLVLGLFGLIGVGAGVAFTSVLPDWIVKASFAAMLVIVASKMIYDIYRKRKDYVACPESFSLRCWLTGTGASILTGFLIGSFGIGGGVVSVPLIIYVYRFEPRLAIGTSALLGAILTPVALAVYALDPAGGVSIHWPLALLLTPIVFVMALIGSTWGLQKLRTNLVKTIFTIGVYIAASSMIYSLLTA